MGRKVIWKSAFLSQLWGPFSKECIKTSISHTNFTNPIAWQWKAHKNRAGTGILWNGLDRWSKPDIPRPARACNRQKIFSFQGGFWKMWHKKYPTHRPEKVKDLLPIDQWSSRVSKPEFTFFVHAYTTEPRPIEGTKRVTDYYHYFLKFHGR